MAYSLEDIAAVKVKWYPYPYYRECFRKWEFIYPTKITTQIRVTQEEPTPMKKNQKTSTGAELDKALLELQQAQVARTDAATANTEAHAELVRTDGVFKDAQAKVAYLRAQLDREQSRLG